MSARPEKTCAACGRTMVWRRRWARSWASVRHCSERCRRSRPGGRDRRLERDILAASACRPRGGICPSEVVRGRRGDDGRALMEPVLAAARRLAAAGRVEIIQGGRAVDPSTARGPIRIRLARHQPARPGDTET